MLIPKTMKISISYATRKGLLDPTQAELRLTYGDQTNGPADPACLWLGHNGHGKQAFAGYFGRINYDYKGKYLLELNGRYDGSSAFPPQDQMGIFSVCFCWISRQQRKFYAIR